VVLVNQITQCTQLRVRPQYDTAAVAAVAAIWTSAGSILLTEKADAATTAVAGLHVDPDFVNEVHMYICAKSPCAGLFVKPGLS